jgi:hypothetical protein
VTDDKKERLAKTYCNGRIPPGIAVVLSCPPSAEGLKPFPGREVVVRLAAPGRLLLTAIVGLSSTAPTGANAAVTLHFVLDRVRVGAGEKVVLGGGEHVQAPAQLLVDAARGAHAITLEEDVHYGYYQPGDVTVSPVSLVVTELPRA